MTQTTATNRRGPKGNDFTQDQLSQIAMMLHQRKRVREILQALGVKERTFYARLRRQGFEIRESRMRILVNKATGEEVPLG